jgi:hypothetical protein
MALTTSADAQTPLISRTLVVPPLEYDYPYQGTLTITRGDKDVMMGLCPKTALPITLGCARRYGPSVCHIYIAADEILNVAGWAYETVRRHEIGHCNGWPNDHAGARPMNAKPALGPSPPAPQLEQPAKTKAPPEKLLNASVPTGKGIDLTLAAALMERGQIWAAERDKENGTAAK